MDLGTRYVPEQIEKKWYEKWLEKGYFTPKGSGEPFVIVIPPPNITGRIHMGHALNMTLQDILIRYKRMRGFDTLCFPVKITQVLPHKMPLRGIWKLKASSVKSLEERSF